jgi:cytochrome c-type biogenesis protein CcmH/NrfG
MSGEALYERYKDALKRGHVASLHGRLDEALDAYAEASSVAPDRPTPHTSAGTALLRGRRPAEALRCYDVALRLAPRDEAALLGRAQSLTGLDRRPEAADAFDSLAEIRAADGALAGAVDAARRGLELAEGRDRRRTLERLIARLRTSEPGEPGRLALERALLVLEGTAMTATLPPAEAGVDQGDEPVPSHEPEDAGAPEMEEIPAGPRAALDRDLPPDVSLDELRRRTEITLDQHPTEAVEALLDLAAADLRLGHASAAMDACYAAVSLEPDHVVLHLALVQLYEDQGWGALATEKLDLLDRLVALDEDAEGAGLLAAARAGRD